MEKVEKYLSGKETSVLELIKELNAELEPMGKRYETAKRAISNKGGDSDHWPDETYAEYVRRSSIEKNSKEAFRILKQLEADLSKK